MRGLIVSLFALIGSTTASCATDVNFTGTLSTVCTLAVPLTGQLGLAADGSLSSEAGRGANLTILSVGSNRLFVEPPVWSQAAPTGYNASGEDLLVKYVGIAGISIPLQDYTDIETIVPVNSVPLTTLLINAKATNPNGFVSGDYAMKVTVTCAP